MSAYVHRYLQTGHINSVKGIDMKWGTFCLWNAEAHTLLSAGGFGLGCVSRGTADDTKEFPEMKTPPYA